MGICFWIGLVISFLFWVVLTAKLYRSSIIVKDTNSIWGWIPLHFIVFFLSLTVMFLCDVVNEVFTQRTGELNQISNGIEKWIYLLIQNGGLVIIAMILSSLVYSIYISGTSHGYFIARHKWLKKLFYSIICISLIIYYWCEIGTSTYSVLNSIVVWMITFIQIWVGFGMDFHPITNLISWKRRLVKLLEDKSERLEMIVCIFSMFLCLVLLLIAMYFYSRIPELVRPFIDQGRKGIAISTIAALLVALILKQINSPLKFMSMMICKNQFHNRKKNFMGVRYAVLRDPEKFSLVIYKGNLEIVENVVFPEEFIIKINDAFDAKTISYSIDLNSEKEIEEKVQEELLTTAQKRKKLLQEAWKMINDAHDEREREKCRRAFQEINEIEMR